MHTVQTVGNQAVWTVFFGAMGEQVHLTRSDEYAGVECDRGWRICESFCQGSCGDWPTERLGGFLNSAQFEPVMHVSL
jgi:hypothetical protein